MLAQRVLHDAHDDSARLELLAETTVSRPLEKEEAAALDQSRQAFEQYFLAKPQDARSLLAVGESRPDPALRSSQLATWTLVASQFLNLDEFVTK
jgi:hypothetical protein